MTSFAGAAQYSFGYYPENTQESSDQPALKDFVYIGSGLLDHGNIFVHEYGHSFDAVNYKEFLTDGRMDSGDEFGYIIKVTDITETDGKPVATIRVTRK